MDESEIYVQSCVKFEFFDGFDLLRYWKEKRKILTIMSAIARDIPTIKYSFVALESCFFCLTGKILNEHITQFSPKSLRLLIRLKVYYDSITREQDKITLENEPSDIEEEITKNEGSFTVTFPIL